MSATHEPTEAEHDRHEPGSLLAHHFDSLEQQHEAGTLGMWVFLSTELLVFGALFTGYIVYRTAYPADFEAGSRHLNLLIAFVNTVVLLTSSLTMVLAVHAAREDRRRALVGWLCLTAALGATFLGIKFVEYRLDFEENLVPGLAFDPGEWVGRGLDPARVQLFLMFYYLMTGLHAIHLFLGIGVVLVLALMARCGRFSRRYHMPVEAWGLYWHFVDIVWIFLLPLLYLIGTRHHWY